MILIRFPSTESKRRALGSLAGRFAFESRTSGEMLVPEDALPFLAVQGVAFAVDGPATSEQSGAAFRGAAAGISRLHIGSPRLAKPEHAADFIMDVAEECRDAGLR